MKAVYKTNFRTPVLETLKNLMRSLIAWLKHGYCSIVVANHRLITVIRFVAKSYTHPQRDFANKLYLVFHAESRIGILESLECNQTTNLFGVSSVRHGTGQSLDWYPVRAGMQEKPLMIWSGPLGSRTGSMGVPLQQHPDDRRHCSSSSSISKPKWSVIVIFQPIMV